MNVSSSSRQAVSSLSARKPRRKDCSFWFFVAGLACFAGSFVLWIESASLRSLVLPPEITTTPDTSRGEDDKSKLHISPEICQNGFGTDMVLERQEVLNTVRFVYESEPQPDKVGLTKVGQALLKAATQSNRYLVTVQVGAMDGVSGDPLYQMYVSEFPYNLTHWIPLAVEPVPANFEDLTQNYQNMQTQKGLPCPFFLRGAIAYGPNDEERTCTFCRFDSASKLENCANHPDWMKYQIGTLDCAQSRRIFQDNYNDCIVEEPVPCGPIFEIMQERRLPRGSIAILKIDIEGYEAILLPNFLKEATADELPPVIHFETKVMHELDRLNGTTTRKLDTYNELEKRGYRLFDQGVDMLALLLQP